MGTDGFLCCAELRCLGSYWLKSFLFWLNFFKLSNNHLSSHAELTSEPCVNRLLSRRLGPREELMPSANGDSCAQGSRLPLCKYYFHIASESTVHADDRGVMLSDLAAAHRYAVSVIWNCMRFYAEEQDWRGWHVKVADDTGRALVIVLFPTAGHKTFGPPGGNLVGSLRVSDRGG